MTEQRISPQEVEKKELEPSIIQKQKFVRLVFSYMKEWMLDIKSRIDDSENDFIDDDFVAFIESFQNLIDYMTNFFTEESLSAEDIFFLNQYISEEEIDFESLSDRESKLIRLVNFVEKMLEVMDPKMDMELEDLLTIMRDGEGDLETQKFLRSAKHDVANPYSAVAGNYHSILYADEQLEQARLEEDNDENIQQLMELRSKYLYEVIRNFQKMFDIANIFDFEKLKNTTVPTALERIINQMLREADEKSYKKRISLYAGEALRHPEKFVRIPEGEISYLLDIKEYLWNKQIEAYINPGLLARFIANVYQNFDRVFSEVTGQLVAEYEKWETCVKAKKIIEQKGLLNNRQLGVLEDLSLWGIDIPFEVTLDEQKETAEGERPRIRREGRILNGETNFNNVLKRLDDLEQETAESVRIGVREKLRLTLSVDVDFKKKELIIRFNDEGLGFPRDEEDPQEIRYSELDGVPYLPYISIDKRTTNKEGEGIGLAGIVEAINGARWYRFYGGDVGSVGGRLNTGNMLDDEGYVIGAMNELVVPLKDLETDTDLYTIRELKQIFTVKEDEPLEITKQMFLIVNSMTAALANYDESVLDFAVLEEKADQMALIAELVRNIKQVKDNTQDENFVLAVQNLELEVKSFTTKLLGQLMTLKRLRSREEEITLERLNKTITSAFRAA